MSTPTRTVPGSSRALAGFTQAILDTAGEAIVSLDRHGVKHDLEWMLGGKPFLTKRGRLVETLTSVVQKVAGVTPEINCTGGTSDGRFIFDICPEVAEFGPVNRSIHKVNEAVALDEIEPLVDVYRLAIQELLGPG